MEQSNHHFIERSFASLPTQEPPLKLPCPVNERLAFQSAWDSIGSVYAQKRQQTIRNSMPSVPYLSAHDSIQV